MNSTQDIPKIILGSLLGSLLFMTEMVSADDANPVVAKLSRSAAVCDASVDLEGRNFGSVAAKVKVSIAGKSCMINFVSDKIIMILTPSHAKPGKTVLLLTVNGRKANAMPFEILDRKEVSEEYWKKQTEEVEVTKRKLTEDVDSKLIGLEGWRTVPDKGGAYKIEVWGHAKKLVDESRLIVRIFFMDEVVEHRYAFVKSNKFKATFGPYRRDLFPGIYRVKLDFLMSRQRWGIRQNTMAAFSKEEMRRYHRMGNQFFYRVGTELDSLQQSKKMLDKKIAIVDELTDSLIDLRHKYASATRCFFRNGKVLEEEKWRQWLKESYLTRSHADWLKVKEDLSVISKSGTHLDAVKWEDYISKNLKKIRKLSDQFQGDMSNHLMSRFPQFNRLLSQLIGTLMDLNLKRTRSLFEYNRIRITRDLESLFGLVPFRSLPSNSVARFKTLLNKIGRLVENEMAVLKKLDKVEKKPGQSK
jgi:hypothetical protein